MCKRGFQGGGNCDICTKGPYPTYGEDCQSICECYIKYCSHVSGKQSLPEVSLSSNKYYISLIYI